jgi:zinc protease
LIRKYYSGWKKGYTSAKITPEPPQTAERGVDVSYPGKTLPILCMAYKGAAFDAENRDFAAARLLCSLAFGETSELYKKLVIREQKAQFLFADVSMNRDVPLWSIAAMVKNPEDIDSVQKDIEETIKKFQSAPVSEQKLADVKRHDKYELLDRLDSPERVAEALTRYIALTGGIEALDQLYATYESVTPEDILRAAKEYYRPERRTIAVLKGEK